MDILLPVLKSSTLMVTGSGSGDIAKEWSAFATLLQYWVLNDTAQANPLPRPLQSYTSSASIDATATSGGSVDSSSEACWEFLLQSDHHRYVLTSPPCLRG